jgi:hypothetical protein
VGLPYIDMRPPSDDEYSSLWRKNSKKRLPNGIQLRLVPCFTSSTGKSMTDT